MKTFLEVYNEWDAAKLQSILARPLDPREHDELAGYKALHGTCTAVKPTKMLPGGVARYTFTCEHGPLEIDVNIAAGKIGGFIGRSPGATPPASVTKLFTTAVGLSFNPDLERGCLQAGVSEAADPRGPGSRGREEPPRPVRHVQARRIRARGLWLDTRFRVHQGRSARALDRARSAR